MESEKKRYGFTINEPKEFDHKRIVKEVLKNNPLSIGFIVKGPGESILLTLFNTFLSQFYMADQIRVCGKILSCNWGRTYSHELSSDNWGNWVFILKDEERDFCSYPFPKKDLSKVLKEIEIAKTFQRKFQIKVEIL